ncbi:CdiA C-terminal domain-containing protein [Micromonospora polyrhachis]|uniref:CdiA C-terminal domain-containing protein n=1 Tax=Micromonospora polyrhachis TaxID=1282883 RepID=UPI0028ABDA6E|nr:hypothetical protein [Micromonospora polyrhachis]
MSPNDKPPQRRALELENECADRVAEQGYRIHQNPTEQEISESRRNTGDAGDPGRSPDFLIEGHVFDCYAPTAHKPVRGVWSEVSKKVDEGQAQRVTLNLQDWQGDLSALQKQFDDWPLSDLKELVAVTRSGAIVQIVKRD